MPEPSTAYYNEPRFSVAVAEFCQLPTHNSSTDLPRNVLVVGAGGHGAVIGDIIHLDPGFKLLGFADSNPDKLGAEILPDYHVLTRQDEIKDNYDPKDTLLFIAVGDNTTRHKVGLSFASLGFGFANAIHPSAVISIGSHLGAGVAVMPGAVVGTRSVVGDFGIINTAASIDHDCIIATSAHIAPGVHMGGTVRVGSETLVGIGSSVKLNTSIGHNVRIASGSSIYKDIDDRQTVIQTTTDR